MLTTHAVGIDLGTTYSCLAYLNEHGEPVTIPNAEGELSTPSVVLFERGEIIVGSEALRNAIRSPRRVVQNSKRWMGEPGKRWTIDGKDYTPVDIAAFILNHLLASARQRLGAVERAVITVPAQFSEAQRLATVEAGRRAGLKQVDVINEPVAAALCFVLGTEGIWFTELATEQRIMVFDLGGGTFDLSLVKYQKNEVRVIASSGDLHLGGIDFSQMLQDAVAQQFVKEFAADPREDPESLQALALDVEQAKRSLSVRPRAAVTCQHAGNRKVYQIEQEQFERIAQPLVDRTAEITKRLLADNRMGWAHVDVVLTTGGASRMPMIRNRLKELSGTTLNTSLSPDQSIAHGATYYAGMLLTNDQFARSILNPEAHERLSQFKQISVNARALGILVRDTETKQRVPHYLVPANTTLPAAVTHRYGTVIPNQRRVHLRIVESGTSAEDTPVELGTCLIDELPPDLPEGSVISVTISYDEQARVFVTAKEVKSGREAVVEIVRQENLIKRAVTTGTGTGTAGGGLRQEEEADARGVAPADSIPKVPDAARPGDSRSIPRKVAPQKPAVQPAPIPSSRPTLPLEDSDQPVPLCNTCGEPLTIRGECASCGPSQKPARPEKPAPAAARPPLQKKAPPGAAAARKPGGPARKPAPAGAIPLSIEDLILEDEPRPSRAAGASGKQESGKSPPLPSSSKKQSGKKEDGEDEFWSLLD